VNFYSHSGAEFPLDVIRTFYGHTTAATPIATTAKTGEADKRHREIKCHHVKKMDTLGSWYWGFFWISLGRGRIANF